MDKIEYSLSYCVLLCSLLWTRHQTRAPLCFLCTNQTVSAVANERTNEEGWGRGGEGYEGRTDEYIACIVQNIGVLYTRSNVYSFRFAINDALTDADEVLAIQIFWLDFINKNELSLRCLLKCMYAVLMHNITIFYLDFIQIYIKNKIVLHVATGKRLFNYIDIFLVHL